MKYSIFKLNFKTAIHIGKGKLSDGEMTIFADTLFSALCQEALKLGGEQMLRELLEAVNGENLLISDCMPFIGKDRFYLPKPMVAVRDIDSDADRDETDRKEYKKLKYIPADKFDLYMKGELDVKEENALFAKNAGEYTLNVRAAVKDGEDAVPYPVGSWSFPKGSGLYFLMGYGNEDVKYLMCDLMDSLSYTGIGGKKSSGMGKFECVFMDAVPEALEAMLSGETDTYMSVATCLPTDAELEIALEDANYMLVKRSGFIDSETYSNTFEKKKDVFMFKSGSCFKKSFSGSVLDISNGGNHPVYRYAKALLVGIK